MSDSPKLNEKYIVARCCRPWPGDTIVGYFSFDDLIKVHRADCENLSKADASRQVSLRWPDILDDSDDTPDGDFDDLDPTDFAILRHHRDFDIDYSLKVARVLNIDKQQAFDRHQKLRDLGLLERVEALIVRYRKKTVDNRWIKHRNHTYYRITQKGSIYLSHFEKDL